MKEDDYSKYFRFDHAAAQGEGFGTHPTPTPTVEVECQVCGHNEGVSRHGVCLHRACFCECVFPPAPKAEVCPQCEEDAWGCNCPPAPETETMSKHHFSPIGDSHLCAFVQGVNDDAVCGEEESSMSHIPAAPAPAAEPASPPELKPCPFCGGTQLKVKEDLAAYLPHCAWIVLCKCGANGENCPDRQSAINVWNVRAAPAQEPPAPSVVDEVPERIWIDADNNDPQYYLKPCDEHFIPYARVRPGQQGQADLHAQVTALLDGTHCPKHGMAWEECCLGELSLELHCKIMQLLKQPAAPSLQLAAEKAAEKIRDWLRTEGPVDGNAIKEVAAIITECFGGVVGPQGDLCGQHVPTTFDDTCVREKGHRGSHRTNRYPTANPAPAQGDFRAGVAACVEKVKEMRDKWDVDAYKVQAIAEQEPRPEFKQMHFENRDMLFSKKDAAQSIAIELESITDSAPPVAAQQEDIWAKVFDTLDRTSIYENGRNSRQLSVIELFNRIRRRLEEARDEICKRS